MRFNSLFSQNLSEEHKVIVDNFWSLKPQSFPNQNLEYAYGKTVLILAQHLQNLQNHLIALETQKFQNLNDYYQKVLFCRHNNNGFKHL